MTEVRNYFRQAQVLRGWLEGRWRMNRVIGDAKELNRLVAEEERTRESVSALTLRESPPRQD